MHSMSQKISNFCHNEYTVNAFYMKIAELLS